jgi:hypothetical protein
MKVPERVTLAHWGLMNGFITFSAQDLLLVLLQKNATLAFEGQSAEGGKLDLCVVALGSSFGNVCRGPFGGPLGPLKAILL